eukprot:scaffold18987_cov109-Isochrysis_galbana.AAC.26
MLTSYTYTPPQTPDCVARPIPPLGSGPAPRAPGGRVWRQPARRRRRHPAHRSGRRADCGAQGGRRAGPASCRDETVRGGDELRKGGQGGWGSPRPGAEGGGQDGG